MELEILREQRKHSSGGSEKDSVTILETVQPDDDEGDGEIRVYPTGALPSLKRRLNGLYAILADTAAYVESGTQCQYESAVDSVFLDDFRLLYLPVDDENFEYAITEHASDGLVEAKHLDRSAIDINYALPVGGLTVSKGELVMAIHDCAEELVGIYNQAEGEQKEDTAVFGESFDILFSGIREAAQHFQAHGTISDFVLNPESDAVQKNLYEWQYSSEDVGVYLRKKGVIRKEVARIQSRITDENTATEMYTDLLMHKSRNVRAGAAEALAEYPDDRAREPLHKTRWTEDTDVVPHSVRALVRLGDDDVRNGLFELLDFSDKEPIRKAAVEGLAEFDESDVHETLEAIREDPAESEDVREAAQRSLERLGN
jgi:hypothetical protein